ncbi:M24 family metallopeptidase, partial [Streptomyces anulatus]
MRGEDTLVDALVPPSGPADAELLAFLSESRLVKDAWEIEQLRAVVGHTVAGFHDVVGELPRHPPRTRGAVGGGHLQPAGPAGGLRPGFETIAAAGAHACVLHWMHNDGPVREGELLLLDAGVEADSFYTGDVTRTLPVGGRFTDVQRRVYDLVFAAQSAGIAALRPGAPYGAFHDAATRVIAEGLDAWGLRPGGAAIPHESDLADMNGIVQSVVTGNIRPVAEVKLQVFGLDTHIRFPYGGCGEDHDDRAELVRT